MENEGLVQLFLAVIALGALVQAGFVAALAVAARILSRKMGELEQAVEQEFLPRVDALAEMAGRVADASEDAMAEVERVGTAMATTAMRVSSTLGGMADKVSGLAEGAHDRLEGALEAGHRATRAPGRRSRALWKGIRRGYEVWRRGVAPARDY